jgi:DNA-binding NarL/FixJ family response regulator
MAGYSTFPDKTSSQLPFVMDFDDREMRTIRLFCQGRTRTEVAADLNISEALVKVIVTNLLNKTGFDSISRLAIFLTSSGYILPNLEV